MVSSKSLYAALAALLISAAAPARAVDGCKVLLCLAGPWQSIPACVGEVEQYFRDLWSGAAVPSCRFASGVVYAPNVVNLPTGTAGIRNAGAFETPRWMPGVGSPAYDAAQAAGSAAAPPAVVGGAAIGR